MALGMDSETYAKLRADIRADLREEIMAEVRQQLIPMVRALVQEVMDSVKSTVAATQFDQVEESVVAMKGTTTENEDTEEPNAENKKLQFVYDKLSHELCKKLEESCFGIRFLPITESGIFRYSLSAHH
ncbi:hypothetical protein Tcan_05963 [Toxocara canis]|uniref:Uncharacterized protein n=1 Tax=Toxocara canis TaxID=6265 RepID=A0A0B2VK46_TOXCA|nr:hypothetical protein Tcan_05963 [Toxocara canis]